ncbi:MAG: hypothetical protein ACREWE_03385 [Gammaproteobacteria bacterium]
MTIAKGIHYPVGGNAVAVPLRCDAEGRVYLADYEPPPVNLSVETAFRALAANATALSTTLDLGTNGRHTLLLARKTGVASNGETIEVQSSPDEAAWTVCPGAAGGTGLAQQQYAIGQAMHVMQARPMGRYVRVSFKNGLTAQTALVLRLTALAGA